MLTIVKSALMALFFFAAPVLAQETLKFDTAPLTVRTTGGKTLEFTVEVAATPDQRAQGLMFRKTMAPDHGMIFDFGNPRPVMMWMKNTPLPLDMLFIDAGGTIRHIKKNAEPFSEAIIDSQGDVKFVVELNGGTAAKLGIAPGDRVDSPAMRKVAQ